MLFRDIFISDRPTVIRYDSGSGSTRGDKILFVRTFIVIAIL